MKRALMCWVALVVLVPSVTGGAQGARRPVRAGDVKGVELQLEGALQAVRGENLRWLFSAYEVVGLDGLRPAAAAKISVSTSFSPREPIEVDADANGRAVVTLPVPLDAPESFGVQIEVHAARGVVRRFDFSVQTIEARVLTLVAQPRAFARTTASAFGRLHRRSDGAGLVGQDVRVVVRDQRGPLGAPIRATTDARGVFLVSRRLPANVQGPVTFEARSAPDEDRRTVSANAQTQIQTESTAPMLVRVAPRQHLVAPDVMAEFDVIVRRADGRPVADAIVRPSPRGGPVFRIQDVPPQERDEVAITDARGRAMVRVRTPNVRQGFADVAVTVQAAYEGVGAAVGQTSIRVAPDRYAAALTLESGALSAELGGRVYVRVATMDGEPAGEVPVTVEGPRVAQAMARTDASGVAVLELSLGTQEDPSCGGASAASVSVRAGSVAQSFCVPVEDDAAVRPRVEPTARPGAEVQVTLARRRVASRLPVAVTVFDAGPGRRVLAYAEAGPGDDSVAVTLPEEFVGSAWIRARPLVGRERQEARGAYTAVHVSHSGRFDVLVRPQGGPQALTTELLLPSGERSVVTMALPTEDARALARSLDVQLDVDAERTPAGVAARLAARVPIDLGASVALRDGELVAIPAPADPVSLGLLRDPWRARARFVEGRLGLLFHAIEAHVDANVPERLDEVATRDARGRLQLNRQLLQSLPEGALGGEGATGLGGEPLTIEELEALDRGFDFDAVAARITRERLFTLMLTLREFVRGRGFDLPWARAGDPALWLLQIRNEGRIPGRLLVDGWGRPFELRQLARARWTRVQPVDGYEIASAGPDGRIGNRDDVFDPTARVLPTTSLYADAVGEDALVARLQGVELGRATVSVASGHFGYHPSGFSFPREGGAGRVQLGSLPPELVVDPFALALERPTVASQSSASLVQASGPHTLELEVDAEPRTWGVVSWAVDSHGQTATGTGAARGGSSILLSASLPSHLRVDEALAVPVHLTNVTEQAKSFGLRAEGERVGLEVPASVDVPPGETRSIMATFRGEASGRGGFTLVVQAPGGDTRELERSVRVDRGRHPIRRVASGAAPFETHLEVPSNALGATTRIVAFTSRALADDPDLADVRRDDPALVAWSRVLSGRPLGERLRADVLRAQANNGVVEGQFTPLSTAAAIVTYSTLFEDGRPDPVAQQARQSAVQALNGISGMDDPNAQVGQIRAWSAVVAALATAGLGEVGAPTRRYWDHFIDGEHRVHSMPRPPPPAFEVVSSWLPGLRTALRDFPEEPTVLARAAAALLLADPRDGHARAMYQRAHQSLREVDEGLRVTSSEERPGQLEELSATLALAVAAQQLGHEDDARAMVRAASRHTPAIARAGGEATFWWLAAGAYGAMGAAPAHVDLEIDGRSQRLDLETGRAIHPLTLNAGGAVDVTSDTPFVIMRVESVFARPFDGSDGLFDLDLRGDAGRVGGVAGYELVVETRAAVGRPVLDVQLPAGVEADEAFLNALESNAYVRSATAREPGFVRLQLVGLGDGVNAPIAMPMRWRSASAVRGLGVVAYPAGDPSRMTVLAPRILDPDEE